MSAGIARLPWPQFFRVLWNREINMTLYYLLLRLWIHANSGEAFLRGLSVIFSVATVPLLYALGARLFGRAAGLAAALLLALSAYQIRYAQEARAYALVAFLATLATLLLVRNLQQPASARWGAYSVVCALVVYAQILAVLLILAHAVSLLWLPRDPATRAKTSKDFGRAARWFTWMILPILAIGLHIGSTPAAWVSTPTAGELSGFFQSAAGNAGIVLAIFDLLLLLAFAFVLRRAQRNAQAWPIALVLSWLLVPPAALLAVSAVRPIFLGRYVMFCTPALALALAAVLARLRPAAISYALLAILSALSIQGTLRYYRRDFDIYREDWRDATAYILNSAQPSDGIFFGTFGRIPYEYYKSQRNSAAPGPAILNWPGGPHLDDRDFTVRSVAEMIGDARPAPDRVWLVLFLDHTPDGRINPTSLMLRKLYEKDRHLVQEQDFPQITVFLFAKDQHVQTAPLPSRP